MIQRLSLSERENRLERRISMNKGKNQYKRTPEENKVSGLSYIFTETGLELPVLDITHPLFEASIDENTLADLCTKSAQAAAMMRVMPKAQKKIIADHSYILGTHFYQNTTATYLSGMGTYMLKLGPQLLGGGEERKIDRMATAGVSGIAARMRLRDLCRYQVELLSPVLKAHPNSRLCLINIAGGAASDTINTLRIILRKEPGLLRNRKIEIHLLEVDTIGPYFAEKSLDALQKKGEDFDMLDLAFFFYHNSWANNDVWNTILNNRNEDIVLCSSEGGLFEYGNNEEIHLVLKTLNECPSLSIGITGSCLLDRETIDPTIIAMAETSGGTLHFLGKEGLEGILKPTSWSAAWFSKTSNPVYLLFSLQKR